MSRWQYESKPYDLEHCFPAHKSRAKLCVLKKTHCNGSLIVNLDCSIKV